MIAPMFRAGSLVALAIVTACSPAQRDSLDSAGAKAESAAGAIGAEARAELSVLDVDIGKRAGTDQDVTEEVETFAPKDTIYASVNTTGLFREGAISSQWTFPDGSVIDQQAQPATKEKDANLLFFLTKAGGLMPGKYTFRVLVDGRESRTQEVTVK